jgi:histone deacetylase 6
VQNSHAAWDPRRKRRKKYGNLQRSPENHLNDMLLAHEDEVRHLLLSKKTDFEEAEQKNFRLAKSKQQALRSPPLPREPTPRINNRHGSVPTSTKGSPGMPQIGFFNVNVSNSPKSPLKKGFGSGYGSG